MKLTRFMLGIKWLHYGGQRPTLPAVTGSGGADLWSSRLSSTPIVRHPLPAPFGGDQPPCGRCCRLQFARPGCALSKARRLGMPATPLCPGNRQPHWTGRNIMAPVLAHTQNEGPPFCCSRRPAPVAASGAQDPRPLPPGPGGAGRTGGTDGRHACPLFAACRALGLRGGERVQNKPDTLYGSHETRPPSNRGRGGRDSPAGTAGYTQGGFR